jgi:hypothetical protein
VTGYRWRSAAAAGDMAEALRTTSAALDTLEARLPPQEAAAAVLRDAMTAASRIYSDFRLIHGQAMWLRRVDIYNKWQVFTEGHQGQLRITPALAERLLNEGLGEALPKGVTLRGTARITMLAPRPDSSGAKDAIDITAPITVEEAGIRWNAELAVRGYISFTRQTAGSLVLLRAPRLVFEKPPSFDAESWARDLEAALATVRLLDRAWLTQLGGLELLGAQNNVDICVFGRSEEPSPVGGPQFVPLGPIPIHTPLPAGMTIAVAIPSSTYSGGLTMPDDYAVHTRGNVKNPWGVGAAWVHDYGLKYRRPINGTIDFGSFGSFSYSLNTSYVYFHLCFEAKVVDGTGQLIATNRLASNGKVVKQAVIRQIPNVAAAAVTMTQTGDVTFAYRTN